MLNFTSFKFKLKNMIVSNKLPKRRPACKEVTKIPLVYMIMVDAATRGVQ